MSRVTPTASLTFATLYLGLILGVRPIEVVATGPVADVAFELDGREVARVFDRPYRQPLDFGVEYAPHELVARAHDAKGKEIALARQWINLPRPPAEVQIVLEKDKSGKAVAVGLAWASRMGPRPTGVVLTFDGRPLPVDIARHARLPEYDASLPHVVSAEVEFPGGLHGRADRVLGGGSADEAGSELTAVPVRGPNERPPSVESLQGRFRKNGEALRVVAVERGPALVFLVRDPAENKEAFRRFGPYDHNLARAETRLEIEDRIQLVWPLAKEIPDQSASNVLFDTAEIIHGVSTNFLFALLQSGSAAAGTGERRFADAVAVAGVSAAANGSRRAVVLVLGEARPGSQQPGPCLDPALPGAHPRAALRLVAFPGEAAEAAAGGGMERVRGHLDARQASRRCQPRAERPVAAIDRVDRGAAPAPGHHAGGCGRRVRDRALSQREGAGTSAYDVKLVSTSRTAKLQA